MYKIKANIRWMIRSDMPEVMEIEQSSFDWAWTEQEFISALARRNCIGIVADIVPDDLTVGRSRVAGFAIYEIHPKHLKLINFAVHPSMRRMGVGSQLIDKLTGKLTHDRRPRISLCVRERNLDAQCFFRDKDFKAKKVLAEHYCETTGEDAYLMEYKCFAHVLVRNRFGANLSR
jgi:ribosomal-protein-alanine N-acetyltransferase